jgi:hypothetical protein
LNEHDSPPHPPHLGRGDNNEEDCTAFPNRRWNFLDCLGMEGWVE